MKETEAGGKKKITQGKTDSKDIGKCVEMLLGNDSNDHIGIAEYSNDGETDEENKKAGILRKVWNVVLGKSHPAGSCLVEFME